MFGSQRTTRRMPQSGCPQIGLQLVRFDFHGRGIARWLEHYARRDRRLPTWTWEKTVAKSSPATTAKKNERGQRTAVFIFEVKYRYTYGGQQFSSEQYKPGTEASDNYSQIARLTAHYPAGSSAVCYVNPSRPAQAVWPVQFVPSVHVLISDSLPGDGGGVIYWAWHVKSPSQWAAQPFPTGLLQAGSVPTGANDQDPIFIVLPANRRRRLLFRLPPARYKVQCARAWPASRAR